MNHAEEALKLIAHDHVVSMLGKSNQSHAITSQVILGVAQVHATLALAEAIRESNDKVASALAYR